MALSKEERMHGARPIHGRANRSLRGLVGGSKNDNGWNEGKKASIVKTQMVETREKTCLGGNII